MGFMMRNTDTHEHRTARKYKRGRLCDQLNSIVTAHGWGNVYGTVE